MMFSGPLKIVPVLICLKTQPYILFKISERILVMEKSTIFAGLGCVFGSTGMSVFHICVNVLCAKC